MLVVAERIRAGLIRFSDRVGVAARETMYAACGREPWEAVAPAEAADGARGCLGDLALETTSASNVRLLATREAMGAVDVVR